MHFKTILNLDSIFYCFRNVSLPGFANISQISTGSFFSIKKDEHKASKKALGVLKMLTLSVFFLGSGNFGVFETFGQNAAIPDISAGVSGSLTCTNTSVKLKGSSNTLGVHYAWTGPRGYYSTAQSPVTAMPGDYTLTVKDPVNGSTATASVKVLIDTIAPVGVKATVSGLLTCIDTLVTLTGSSSTSGVTYDWKGPKGYVSTMKNPVTAIPGIYAVKIINPENGCMSKANVAVIQNITPPSGIAANVSGMLTCNATSVKLTGMSATKDVHYRWTGPDFTSSVNKPDVTAPGTYALMVTDPINGCSSKAIVTVKQDVSAPAQVIAVVSDTLTCKKAKVTLTASSATKEAIFSWLGPQAFVSSELSFETSMVGDFALTVTNPENGCSVKKQVTVVKDTTEPAGVVATALGVLTCNAKSVTLNGYSSSPKVVYTWNGPANFTSNSATPSVSISGRYEVIVTKTTNGCSTTKFVKVDQNMTAPDGVTASVSGSLSCKTPSIKLDGKSASAQVTYTWIGPQSFKSNEKSPEIKFPGSYILTATNPENGCTSKADVTVSGVACTEKEVK
jgi:hypothetical protein